MAPPATAPQARTADAGDAFKIKGTNFNLVVLQLLDPRADAIVPALDHLLTRAPAFLRDAPIVLGLSEISSGADELDFAALIEGLRSLRLYPLGTTGGSPELRRRAAAAGLPAMPKGSGRAEALTPPAAAETAGTEETTPPASEAATPEPEVLETEAPEPADGRSEEANAEPAPAPGAGPLAESAGPAKVVTEPVRSGRRIYAQGGDLVVTSTVNPGAEIIADGHVHVYGALRGRVIAGAAGNADARIFALNFDPELVAIAGFYQVREHLDPGLVGRSVQIELEGERIRYAALG